MERPQVSPDNEAPHVAWGRDRASALGRRPTRRSMVPRGMLLPASLVAALLFAGVAAPGLAQAWENPQPTTASSSGEPENPCDYNVTVPGMETGITIGTILAQGFKPAVFDALPPAKYIDILILMTKCTLHLNSNPYPSGQTPNIYNPPGQEGATCYSDIEGQHPVRVYKNGQCVEPQEQDPSSQNTPPPQNNSGYRLPCILPDGSQGEINNATGTCGPLQ